MDVSYMRRQKMTGLVIAFFIGGFIGFILTALMVASSRYNQCEECELRKESDERRRHE